MIAYLLPYSLTYLSASACSMGVSSTLSASDGFAMVFPLLAHPFENNKAKKNKRTLGSYFYIRFR